MQTSKKVKDPVCLMELDPDEAVESEDYLQHRYYFCNANCHETFQLDPEPYAKRLQSQDDA
ncbi:YHS domain-containing protein [Candidatus Nitrospira nitrificans]|uniref:YHS domain protein n=1 Tax=Candidatus Nitrospira nitrificans TaxID=1742973 RepID=A0A0S4LU25_9BACT|nr:YHS domain-containing protein [Candidatus Nitrospira nitrificans]CUS39508.1 YHS domain protein [Candidatus Nitrospira nitrificans]